MPKKTRHTRKESPQKRRNIRTLFRKHPIWTTVGILIVGGFLSWGLPMIPYDLHDGLLIIFAGVLISVLFFVQAYQLYAHRSIKRRNWIILITLVILGVVLMMSQLQFTHPRPKLRVDFDSPDTTVYTTNSTAEISFRIVNRGQSAACQYYAIIFAASENRLQEVTKLTQRFGTVCRDPGEPVYCTVHLNITKEPTGTWYMCYKLIYGNSPTGGHLYTDDYPYWILFDFSNTQQPFMQLTPEQRDIFKAAIEARFPDEDIE